MQLRKSCKLESATASKSDAREKLRHAYLDTDKARMVATDGHILAIVPVEVDPGDASGYVPTEALTTAKKLLPRSTETLTLACNSSIAIPNGPSYPRPDESAFPNVDAVLPNPETRLFSVALDPELLVNLAKALGSAGVVLSFDPANGQACILVRPYLKKSIDLDGRVGAIMPMALK